MTCFTISAILHWSGGEATACCSEALGMAALHCWIYCCRLWTLAECVCLHWSSGSPIYKDMLPKLGNLLAVDLFAVELSEGQKV